MGGNSDQPSQTVTRPVRLPTAMSPQVVEQRRRAATNATDRTGRSSTVLSDALRNLVGSKGKLGA